MVKYVIKKVSQQNGQAVIKNSSPDTLNKEQPINSPDSSQAVIKNSPPDILNKEQPSDSPDSSQSKELAGGRGGKHDSGQDGGIGSGLDGENGRGPDGGNESKKGMDLFLIPIIVLAVIAVFAWSWLALLSPGFSKKAEPYISKYFSRIISVLSFQSDKNLADGSSITIETPDKSTKASDENTQSANESSGSSATNKENGSSKETTKDDKKPSIDLQIYEGPIYSAEDNTCSYSVKAVVTGDPTPVVIFSRDDSKGSLGPKTTRINLKRNATQYILTATARNEYGTAMDSLTINWGCNLSPVISEIKLSSDVVYVNKEYDLSVTATDPDKDSLTYKWTVTGGKLSADNAPTVKWTAPPNPENYQVKVDVKDSKGALTSKTISVYVGSEKAPETTAPPATAPPTTAPPTTAPPTTAPQQSTLDLPKKSTEGGYLEFGGETFAGGNVYAGDSASNKPCMGFISFDISPLAGKTISTARLTFTGSSVQGNPLSYCDSFVVNVVKWGAEPIVQNDFSLTGIAIQSFTSPDITCTADKLKTEIQNAINSGKTRFQIRVHFAGPYSNNNSAKDGWEYAQQSINLSVTF